jgi:methylenetetrahydrofolate--tRNA-(uracil-5-)-methyltransferase
LVTTVHVIGGGLAGTEAAFQLAQRGIAVVLFEMRPVQTTPAHQTDRFAELVCSNSLKSDQAPSASWLLKEELRRLGSLAMRAAEAARVPGGHALTVDREIFGEEITRAMEHHPLIEVRRQEVCYLDHDGITVIASGPLTSPALAAEIGRITGSERLYFYDSISPIVDAESVDLSIAFRASRYGKSLDGTDDYLNCPMNRAQYEHFVEQLLHGQAANAHIAEDATPFFESCLPIEEIARRGKDTLRFGPMKPMGLDDPKTGRRPWAVVQLRQEDLRAGSWNIVGFQNHLKFGEQRRIFRMIPGLENAEFLRYGQIHRNTYINGPSLLNPNLQLKSHPKVFFAGQISGVEGYVESIATGFIAGCQAAAYALDHPTIAFPRESALGSLCHYITAANPKNYQPANIAMDLFPEVAGYAHDKKARHSEICRRALAAIENYTHATV